MLPNQYRRRSTVYVERLRGISEGARYGDEDLYATDAYITITNRFDGTWSHSIELKGEVFKVPNAVLQRINQQHEQILKEQRSVQGQERAIALRKKAQADQDDAYDVEAERVRDLGAEDDWRKPR
jgi:hypothetical protein